MPSARIPGACRAHGWHLFKWRILGLGNRAWHPRSILGPLVEQIEDRFVLSVRMTIQVGFVGQGGRAGDRKGQQADMEKLLIEKVRIAADLA